MANHNYYLKTPLFESQILNQRLGKRIFFKMETFQPTRSFKLRGMDHLVKHHVALGNRLFVGSSGGNAGYSLAYAGRMRGAKVKVFVPESTLPKMIALIRAEGAELIVAGPTWQEADAAAQAEVANSGAIYVSPFDNPLLWEGHASMMEECAQEIDAPDLVVAAVGGGGLLCGILEGMENVGWEKTEFLGAETTGAASFAAAILAGKLVGIPQIDTIATSLGAKTIAEAAFLWTKSHVVESYICSDRQALEAVADFAEKFNVLVEPACGAALINRCKSNRKCTNNSCHCLWWCSNGFAYFQQICKDARP